MIQQKQFFLFPAFKVLLLCFLAACYTMPVSAQLLANTLATKPDTSGITKPVYPEKDLGDLFKKKGTIPKESSRKDKHFSFVPAAGYSLQTGWAAVLSANVAYYNDTLPNTKLSSISSSITYSQYNQVLLPLVANIWTKNNKYNIISDNRYINYPSNVYGFGGQTNPNRGYQIAFKGLKLHETVMKSISKNWYAGIGYYFDQFWDIKPLDSLTLRLDNILHRELGLAEAASGFTLKVLYDNRLNQINAKNGWYANFLFRDAREILGSKSNWQSLLVDVRKYINFPKGSRNTLALWSFNWITISGTPPYLLLPSTGWDDQYNTGRGYIQGRYRGKKMYYAEAEYRFDFTRNGMVGGVVFGNLQYFSPEISKEFQTIIPGYGGGLRFKLNKHSGANLCIDYGLGKDGSQGFFVNLGEVF